MQDLSPSKTYAHNLLDKTSVVDRHRCHMAAKFGVFVGEDHSFLPYTGYLNFIKDPISHGLLPILVHVLLLSCLYFSMEMFFAPLPMM